MRDSGLKAYTAKAMSGKVSDTLEQMQSYSALLIGLLFLMAVLALICIFNITVNERLKEFGVLLSIGARKSQIFQMLLLEAGMIGVLGGFLGVVHCRAWGLRLVSAFLPPYMRQSERIVWNYIN